MSFSTTMQPKRQPKGSGQGVTPKVGDENVYAGVEAADQGQVQAIEEQLKAMNDLAALIEESARKLAAESHGQAYQEVSHARQQADVTRASAESAKSQIQSARAHSRDGKCHLSTRALAAITTHMSVAIRIANQEKAALEKAAAEYRSTESAAARSAAAAAQAAPSITQSITRAIKEVTHVSVAAVVGPPVFGAATPKFSMDGLLHEASEAASHAASTLEKMADAVLESSPVARVRALGRATWQGAKEVGASVASGVSQFVAAPVETTKKVAKIVAHKAVELKDGAVRVANEYIAQPAMKAADAVATGAKRAYSAAGQMTQKAMGAAQATWLDAKKMASNLWPFSQETPVKAPVVVATKQKTSPEAMAWALHLSGWRDERFGFSVHNASAALLVSPMASMKMRDLPSVFTIMGMHN